MGRFSSFDGQVALITGAAYGIGAATAKELADLDAKVVVADANEPELLALVADIREAGGDVEPFVMDQASEVDQREVVDFAVRTYGGLHLAVNSSGYGSDSQRSGEFRVSDWDRQIDLNLNSIAYAMRYQLEQFMDQERTSQCAIVNIASVHGHLGARGHSAYTAAKHGVIGLTRTSALEYASKGIRINAVSPAYVRDTMLAREMDDEDINKVINAHPLGRLGNPEEVAHLVRFLLSSDASYITGSALAVDGGYSAG